MSRPFPADTYHARAVRGLAWSGAAQIGRQILALATMIILSRQLDTGDFGLTQMILALTGYGLIVADSGLSGAVIQRRDLRPDHMASAFWTNLALGAALTLAMLGGAPLIARFYKEPRLVDLCAAMSPLMLLSGASALPRALLTRDLNFRAIAIIDAGAAALAGIVSILMAHLDYGVWAIAALYLLTAATTWALGLLFNPWRFEGKFRLSALRELSGFGLHLFGDESLGYFTRNVDNAMIGRRWGAAELGPYGLAYQIMLVPLANVSRVVARALFPSFAEIQNDPDRMRGIFVQLTRVIALITFPALIGLAVVARPFTLAVFGPRWEPMIPILRILCAAGAIQTIVHPIGAVLLAKGRADLALFAGLPMKAISVGFIFWGLRSRAVGVAWGVLAASVAGVLPNVLMMRFLIGLRFRDFIAALAPTLAMSTAMATAVVALDWLLPAAPTLSAAARLPALVLFGAAVFAGLAAVFRPPALLDLIELAASRRRRAERGSDTPAPKPPAG